MRVTIQLFAVLREQLGDSIEIDVPEPVTSTRLMERFFAAYPQFRAAAGSLNLAVDQSYVIEDEPILPGQEVAIFPPGERGLKGPGNAANSGQNRTNRKTNRRLAL